jgi:hypothetical protein
MERVGLVGGVGIHAVPHAGVFVVHVRLRQNQKSGLIAARKTF